MAYTRRPTSKFLKDVSKLDDSIKVLINKKLKRIEQNPRLSKPLKHMPNLYSERIGIYRIIFEVMGNEIIFYRVAKRDEAYTAWLGG